ncbi:gastrula zinc finger protein XlCGF7.1-like [Ornithodoros turicata]|uniref:gastrula zinc finger protein XlCGF7.1-like n=1 Tax=Ornithodoros turicata TaxID=34597 RepID=UPI0031391D7E
MPYVDLLRLWIMDETEITGCEDKSTLAAKIDLRVSRLIASLYSTPIYTQVRSFGVQTLTRTYSKATQTPVILKGQCEAEDSPTFRCGPCNLVLPSKALLKEHQVEKHFHKDGRNYCRFCDYSSHCATNVKVHERRHTGEKPYICRVCLRPFAGKGNLDKHCRTIHEGERKHQCPMCGLAFTQKIHLQEHLRVHSDERPFKCEHCGKAFTLKSGLRTHLRLHNREKPYSCTHCGKSFTQLSHLKCHTVTVHTKDFPHRCRLCNKGFCRPAELSKHVHKKHQTPARVV